MPRQARIVLANTPHHIVERGHNRETVFIEPQDSLYYLDTLKESLKINLSPFSRKNKSVPFFHAFFHFST